jgi:hypothetical protein
MPCLVAALLGGCTCGSKHAPPSTRAVASIVDHPSAAIDASAERTSDAAEFSAPIGAARVGHVDVVAGLVAAEGAVRVKGLAASGGVAWTVDALRGVSWAPDAELRLQPAGDGVVVFWRGLRDGKTVRTLMLLGPRGEPRGEPIEIGATFCTTAGGLAWIGPHTSGPSRVRARRWSEPAALDVVAVSADRDPSLVCGERDVIVLGDGDDDLIAARFEPGDTAARPPKVALRDADFADEQREHDAYSIGDDLGLVRVGASGAVALREVPRDAEPGPWRKLKHAVSADDDIVTVDGDAAATLIVVTHDTENGCPGTVSTSESVRAIRVDRATREESILELASPDCDHSRGPFWVADSPSGPVVGWVERRTALPPKTAPIAGMSFRVLAPGGVRAGHIEQPADALVDAGCDERACSVAALVRPLGGDGMQPAPIRVFGYP